MPKQCYVDKNFSPGSLELIEKANEIIKEYQRQGFDLTLRQLYYQFVARDIIENSQKQYKRLGSVINDARLAGLVDWYAIEDRTRNLRALAHWDTPEDIIRAVSKQFRRDKWEDQPNSVEVWIEKDALVGLIAGVCNKNDVPFFSCRGYTSQSEMWRAAQRSITTRAALIKPAGTDYIIHLGDHDPSGIDMTRDIEDRMHVFGADRIKIIRIALNMDQVEEFDPPPNPAKLSDTRAQAYIEEYGDESWELDALNPPYIEKIIQEEIDKVRDDDIWKASLVIEEHQKQQLKAVYGAWGEVLDHLVSIGELDE